MNPSNNINPSARYSSTNQPTVRQPPNQGQAGFEQHLGETPQVHAAGARPSQVLGVSQDERLIQEAADEATKRGQRLSTVDTYKSALRRLADALKPSGQTLATLNDESLVDHAKRLFPKDGAMIAALLMLRPRRVPAAPSTLPYLPSKADELLIMEAGDARFGSSLRDNTAAKNSGSLRKLSSALAPFPIAMLDHDSLVEQAKTLFPTERKFINALDKLRKYREGIGLSTASAGKDTRSTLEPTAHLPVQSVGQERLLGSATDRGDEHDTRAIRQITQDNVAIQALLSENRVLMRAATSLLPHGNEAQIGRASADPNSSDLRNHLASAPESGPEASQQAPQPPDERDGPTLGASKLQPAQTVLIGRSKRPVYSEDAPLILGLEAALIQSGAAKLTAKVNVGHLLALDRWLFENKKPGIAARLGDQALDDDVEEFVERGGNARTLPAVAQLKASQSAAGVAPIVHRAILDPYADDAALISNFELSLGRRTIYPTALRGFSHYLRQNNMTGIADRLNDPSLAEDAKRCEASGGSQYTTEALGCLRGSPMKFEPVSRRIASPEDAVFIEAASKWALAATNSKTERNKAFKGASAVRRLSQWLHQNGREPIIARLNNPDALKKDLIDFKRATNETQVGKGLELLREYRKGHDLEPLVEGASGAGEQAKGEAGSTSMPGVDLEGLWRLPEDKVEQPATDPQQVQQLEQRLLEEIQGRQDDQPAADPRQSSLSLNLASDHQHKMMDTLGTNSHLLPSAGRIIHGEHYTALVRPMKRQRTFDGPQSLAIERQLSQIGSSDQANKAQELPQAIQTNPDELRDQFTSPDFPPSSGEPGPGHHPVPQLPDRSNAPKLEASALQAGRSTLVTVGADKRALYAEDASLIGVLDSALHQGRVSDNTIKLNVNPLLHFARWLVANGKQSFASRLDETSLNQDLQQYAASGGPSLEVAMGHLKTASAGDLPMAGRSFRNPHSLDGALIERYKATPSWNKLSGSTAKGYIYAITRLSDYLQRKGKMGIAPRLNQKSLNDDVKLYPGDYTTIEAALAHLRRSGAGESASRGNIAPFPHPADAVARRVGGAAAQHRAPQRPANFDRRMWPTMEAAPAHSARVPSDTFGGLQSFVDLNAPTPSDLDDDAHFAPAHSARAPSGTFGGLQSFVDLNAPTPSDLHDDAHFAPVHSARAPSGTFGGLQSFVDLNAPTPSDLHDDAHFAPVHSARAPSGTFGGLQSFVDLNAPTPSDLRDDAHFAPVHSARAPSGTFGGLQSFVDLNAPTPSDLRDDAHFAPAHSAGAPSGTFGGLQSFVDLNAPTPSDLRDDAHSAPVRRRGQMFGDMQRQRTIPETEAAAVKLMRTDDVQHRGQALPMSAPAAPARQPAMPATAMAPDTYRGLPLIDVTTPASPSSDARIGGLDRTASSRVAAGSVLGATEWLSDAHIQRDYDFLEQQLQGIDPALAARIRLVSPSVSHLLRHLGEDAGGTLQSIYHQSDAPADFLFLPVNNGTATRAGTHWSLLFVDGRNPQSRVAYHYDSLQQAGYNDAPARQLAEGLTATLAPARMPRQSNDHDCGVFVVDGTWALVQRLLDGNRPDHEPLHLDNLVADRQALQNRLTRL